MTKTNIIAEPGKQEIVINRIFDAPRELVFKIWTDPSYIPEWWGPRRLTTVVDKMDVRKGGIWRYINRDNNANEISLYPSIEVRDGVLQSGMSEGAIELMDRFEELLAKLQVK